MERLSAFCGVGMFGMLSNALLSPCSVAAGGCLSSCEGSMHFCFNQKFMETTSSLQHLIIIPWTLELGSRALNLEFAAS